MNGTDRTDLRFAASFTAFENFVMDLRDSNDHENGTNEPTTDNKRVKKKISIVRIGIEYV